MRWIVSRQSLQNNKDIKRCLIIAAFFVFLALPSGTRADFTSHIVISQLQTAGASAKDEFVELYNPLSTSQSLSTWSIQYKSATGSTFQKKNIGDFSIPAHGYFLIANTDYKGSTISDVTHNSFSIAATGGNLFLTNTTDLLTTTSSTAIVDHLAWGDGNAPEGSAAGAPDASKALEREPADSTGNGIDTDNNVSDFTIVSSHPRNTSSPTQTLSSDTSSSSTTTTPTSSSTTSSSPSSSTDTTTTSPSSSSSTTSSTDASSTSSSTSSSTDTSSSSSSSSDTSSSTSSPSSTTSSADTQSPSSPSQTSSSNGSTAQFHDVELNELLIDPASGDKEWVELKRLTASPIDLNHWNLEDGKGTIATIDTPPLSSFLYFTIEFPSAHLNNDGDRVILKDSAGTIIDAITYGSWNDGNASDNAPTASNGQTIGRHEGVSATGIDAQDWALTSAATKNAPNIFAPAIGQQSATAPTSSGAALSNTHSIVIHQDFQPTLPYGSILINELVSDPSDNEQEWVELVNTSGKPISLDGWWIEEGSQSKTPITGTIGVSDIENYIVVSPIKGNLNNDGDTVILKDSSGAIIHRMTYGSWNNSRYTAPVAHDPNALARIAPEPLTGNDTLDYRITPTPTKGRPNAIPPQSQPSSNLSSAQRTTPTSNAEAVSQSGSSSIVLNELFPNPRGADNGNEWIELRNTGNGDVMLAQWSIVSERHTFTWKNNAPTIAARDVLIVTDTESGIRLPNSAPITLTLRNPDKMIVSATTTTGKAPEGSSWARDDNGHWQWTTTPTPNALNRETQENQPPVAQLDAPASATAGETILLDGSDSYDPEDAVLNYDWTVNGTNVGSTTSIEYTVPFQKEMLAVTLTVSDGSVGSSQSVTIPIKESSQTVSLAHAATQPPSSQTASRLTLPATDPAPESISHASLSRLGTFHDGDQGTFTAIVSMPAGVLGKRLFAVAGSGVVVELKKGDVPLLAVGDRITFTAKLRHIGGERRLVIAQSNDLRRDGHDTPPPAHPIAWTTAEEQLSGTLASGIGTINHISGTTLTATVNGKSAEILLAHVSDTNAKLFHEGDAINVTGILRFSQGGVARFYPRTHDDITIADATGSDTQQTTDTHASPGPHPSHAVQWLMAILALLLAGFPLALFYFTKTSHMTTDTHIPGPLVRPPNMPRLSQTPLPPINNEDDSSSLD